MSIQVGLWVTWAALVGALVSLNVAAFCAWRYVYWSEKARTLREQIARESKGEPSP